MEDMFPVELDNVTVAYHKKPVLQDISLQVPEGKLIGIIGPNGAGKSTLIKTILGLVPRASGDISIYGKDYKDQRTRIGYVPQRGSVDWDFPTSALDVVLMGRYGRIGLLKRPKKADVEMAKAALAKVGMLDYAKRQISQLSGGQQQRVFLARALCQNADIYFMDEPFAGVDAATERAIMTLLAELKEKGKTVLVVHHDLQTAEDYFDWILLLHLRKIAFGPAENVFTIENLQKTYGGRLTFLKDKVLAEGHKE
ncbi:transport system ATP-binding protein [Bacillus subtilis]|nr:transport system ATP-binding protein [Bacillus subtilis]BAI86589.2 manganese ABC transporter, ATP-binding protein [Bacillus subtilis subsp. natto BEST195]